LPHRQNDCSTPEQAEFITEIYSDFDFKFQDRPDYAAWRCAIVPPYARRRPWLADCTTPYSANWSDWTASSRSGAESSDPVIVWSTTAIAPDLIDAAIKKGANFADESILGIFRLLYERLRFELTPLPQCVASCGMAAFVFIMRFQSARRAANQNISPADVQECLDQLVRWALHIDPDWEPGQKIKTAKLEDEIRGQARLRASYGIREFDVLTKTLCDVPPFVWKNLLVLDAHSIKLTREACRFAYTAWRTTRSRRIWETEYQKRQGIFHSEHSKRKRLTATLRDIECVRYLSTALRDAENHFDAAKVMYLLLRLIPDEFVNDSEIRKILRRRWVYFLHMKEAGLEVDPRFQDLEQHAAEQELHEIKSEDDPVAANKQGFFLVLERDQRTCPEWPVVLNAISTEPGEGPKGYIRRVMRTLADCNQPASSQLLCAGFALAHRYGYVRSAGKMLERLVSDRAFEITKEIILDFVHDVRRCMSLDPFGMHHPTAVEWQKITIAACAELACHMNLAGSWFTPTEKLWVHETLIGRTHTHHRSLGHANRLRLFRKAARIHDDADLREFYDLEYNFFVRPLGVATSEPIARFCGQYEGSKLGAPIFLSLLCMQDVLSLVSVNKKGNVSGSETNVVGLASDLQEIATQAEFWFKSREIPFDEQIGWPQTLKNIGHAVLNLASKSDPNARVIILSVEPHLAQLPWQQLIGACVSDSFDRTTSAHPSATRYLISLVPNATTMTIRNTGPDDFHQGCKVKATTDSDEAISQVLDAIESTNAEANNPENSVCIVLGHGKRSLESSLPTIALGNETHLETIDEWLDVLQSKHIILHCCHSGDTKPIYLQELGGLPGVGLALGCSVIIAPSAEVSGQSAAALQRRLFLGSSVDTIGEKYLQAISDDPGVCLYNLFGNPYETFRTTSVTAAIGSVQSAVESV
jgi:hypothetical protein